MSPTPPSPARAAALFALLLGAAASVPGAGCNINSAYDAQRDNPLGPSFWIIPVPSDDDALLGRTFARPPDTSLTLEEQSSPNPCADKLAERKESQMANHYENAINTNTSAKAGGMLALYGFGAEVGKATHLLYKVDTSTKLTRMDTAEYQECCKQKGCGWGYVASLVRGAGEYAAGTEATAQVSGNYSVVSGGVSRSYAVSNKKNIKGYIAAILVAHNRAEAAQACAPGQVWAKIECVDKAVLAREEELCKRGNPQASEPTWKDNAQMQALFKQQQDSACQWLANHGGPPAPPPPPPPVASAPPATPAGPAPAAPADAPFEPGDYVAINSFWSGKMTFRQDGTFERDSGQKGVWMINGKKLTLKWGDGTLDELDQSAPGTYKNFTGFFQIQRTGPSAPAPAVTSTPANPGGAASAPPAASSAPPPDAPPPDRRRRR